MMTKSSPQASLSDGEKRPLISLGGGIYALKPLRHHPASLPGSLLDAVEILFILLTLLLAFF